MKSFSPNDHFFYYLYYIQERMNIFWNRLNGCDIPYSDDPIFQNFKFTNVYRVLDRSSQYLIKNIVNKQGYTIEETFWRILIYKHFNLPRTWDLLINEFGDINKEISLGDISKYLVSIKDSETIYSNAYMMTSAFLAGDKGKYTFLKKNKWFKHQYYFYIFEKELIEQGKLFDILNSCSFEQMFNSMNSVTSFGDFTSYQYCQDLNYTKFFNFDDNEFCSAGPGTIRGILRSFNIEGKPDFGFIVKWVQKNYENLVEDYNKKFSVDLKCKMIDGWDLKVPDFSNSFCETDKYMRQIGISNDKFNSVRMKQKFKQNDSKIDFVFPEKWGVNLKQV